MTRRWGLLGLLLMAAGGAWSAPYVAPDISGRKIDDQDFVAHTEALERVDAIVRSDTTQLQNYVLAAPTSGPGTPSWRALVPGDTPLLVQGPASATQNALVRFDQTTGKLVKNSPCVLSDLGVFDCPQLAGPGPGSFITWKESSPGANTVSIRVSAAGLTDDVIIEFTTAGRLPAAAIESTGANGVCAQFVNGVLTPTASPCGAGATTTTTTSTTTTTTAGSQAAPDWTSSMVAVWRLEEDGATVRDNAQGTVGRDFTPNASIARTATGAMEGTYGIACPTGNEGLYYLSSTDDALDTAAAPLSMAVWVGNSTNNDALLDDFPSVYGQWGWDTSDIAGVYFSYSEPEAKYQFVLGDGAGGIPSITKVPDGTGGDNSAPYGSTHHLAGTLSADELTATMFLDGAQQDQVTTATGMFKPVGLFRLCMAGTSSPGLAGTLDEAVFDDVEWTATEACRITRCGVDGKLCECNGAAYKTCSVDADCRGRSNTGQLCDGGTCRGRGSSLGITCTPAACDAGAPS